MPAHRELVKFAVRSRHDVHGWFGSPLLTSPKASGVLIALQKLFLVCACLYATPPKREIPVKFFHRGRKAASTATINPQAPIKFDS